MRNEDLNDIDFFEAGEYYHIYNRAIGCEQLFRVPMNYDLLLKGTLIPAKDAGYSEKTKNPGVV